MYLMQFDNAMPDPGVERRKEIDQILAVVESGEPLSEADREQIGQLRAKFAKRFCHQCGW